VVNERHLLVSWLAVLALMHAAPALAADFIWNLPRGFPQPAVPADNPMTEAKVALGAKLFADTRLSRSGRHSCQSCHAPERAFTDGLSRSRGVDGADLPLNAPTILNAAYNPALGWNDTGVHSLEQQMRGPLFNQHPAELGLAGRETAVEAVLAADSGMLAAFREAFPGVARAVSMDNVIRAIAAFERTLFAGNSDFDRHVFAGDHAALAASQRRGMQLFFSPRSGCSGCHGGINFAGAWVDHEHPVAKATYADAGSGRPVRVPTLRNVESTAPYLHDGRLATLSAVLEHYESLAADPAADPRLRRAPLTTLERVDLEGFLRSLTDRQ
jgi:cytochrome c peroxidase